MPYDVGKDPYIDIDTGVLRNLLGKTTAKALDEAEANIAWSEISLMLQGTHPKLMDLTYEFFLAIHKQLFGAIYDWAGQLRTVEVSKGATSFARADYLQANLEMLFQQLAADDHWSVTDKQEFTEKLAYYYGELNVLHPFREGNGRTIRTFLSLLADCHGYYIAWGDMTAAENIQASIASYNGDEVPMRQLLLKIVQVADVV